MMAKYHYQIETIGGEVPIVTLSLYCDGRPDRVVPFSGLTNARARQYCEDSYRYRKHAVIWTTRHEGGTLVETTQEIEIDDEAKGDTWKT